MEQLIPLKEAKTFLGVSIKTLQRWDIERKIKVIHTAGGRRRIPVSEIRRLQGITPQNPFSVGYARVSSATQKDDLCTQLLWLQQKGLSTILTDIGSGLNEKRKNYRKLIQMVTNRQVQKIVVTYPDRLTRFGFATLQQFCASYNASIEVLNEKLYTTPQEELVQDLITLIAHFSGKLYGLRSHKTKNIVQSVKKIVQQKEEPHKFSKSSESIDLNTC